MNFSVLLFTWTTCCTGTPEGQYLLNVTDIKMIYKN